MTSRMYTVIRQTSDYEHDHHETRDIAVTTLISKMCRQMQCDRHIEWF